MIRRRVDVRLHGLRQNKRVVQILDRLRSVSVWRWIRRRTGALIPASLSVLLLLLLVFDDEVTSFLQASRLVSPPPQLEYRISMTGWDETVERSRAEYTVRRGDTVCEIAGRWRVPCQDVMRANAGRFEDEFSMPVGMALYLPLRSLASGQ